MAGRRVELTDEGKRYAELGLPEKLLADALRSGPLGFDEARKRVQSFDIALQWAKKNGWVDVKDGRLVLLKQAGTSTEQDSAGVSEQRPTRQSVSARQVRPDTLHTAWTPDCRQLVPLLQSTPASESEEKLPPGTPVIEPELSSTTSMLALWIWRSMMTRGLTRASATGATTRLVSPASAVRARTRLCDLDVPAARLLP